MDQLACLCFHDFFLGHDLGLEQGYLVLNGVVLSLQDFVEGAPFALDVVGVEPIGWELVPIDMEKFSVF
jgi:hypothetical protein